MRMVSRITYVAAVIFLTAISLGAQNGKNCLPLNLSRDKIAFKGGENLVYTVHYKLGLINADVAQATLKLDSTVLNGQKCYHGSLRGKTQKIYEQVFKLKEDFDCWFTCDGLKPVKFTRDCVEGNYWCTNLYTYSSNEIHAKINNSKKGEFTVTLPKDDCTYDVAMLFFMLQNMNVSKLKEGGRYPMSYACDHKVHDIHFVYYGKETRKVAGKQMRCLKFGFEVPKGESFDGDKSLMAWFSDDDNKIPVYFVAPLKVGQVRGRLNSYSGLKNPVSCIVE